jgi:hypothetical protein
VRCIDGVGLNTSNAVLEAHCGRKKLPVFCRSVDGYSRVRSQHRQNELAGYSKSTRHVWLQETYACCKLNQPVDDKRWSEGGEEGCRVTVRSN